MQNGQFIWKHQKQLRTGYTTGSCAAGAAKAAAYMLLGDERIEQIELKTPKGITLYLDIHDIMRQNGRVSCAVKKDAGDDPDITDGIFVYACVEKTSGTEVAVRGGTGVGTVTRKGLEQEVGQPAINRVPHMMIREAVEAVRDRFGCKEGLTVTISIPEGVRIAEKTFNPRLGITGGISVLGTTGIVEPMSEKALIDTIGIEMKVMKESGHDFCYVVPGNYGADFLTQHLGYEDVLAVKCSNFIGETLDIAVRLEMKGLLLIGHAGKLIKLAAGIMNTHSRQADGRMEILAAHAAMAGAGPETVAAVMGCITTEEAFELLAAAAYLKPVMATVMKKAEMHLRHRSGNALQVEAVIFTQAQGIVGTTSGAGYLLEKINSEKGTQK